MDLQKFIKEWDLWVGFSKPLESLNQIDAYDLENNLRNVPLS